MYNILNVLSPAQQLNARRVTLKLFTDAHNRVIYSEDQLLKILLGITEDSSEVLRVYKMLSLDRQVLKESASYIRKCYPEDYENNVKPFLKRRVININTLH